MLQEQQLLCASQLKPTASPLVQQSSGWFKGEHALLAFPAGPAVLQMLKQAYGLTLALCLIPWLSQQSWISCTDYN